MPKIDQNVRYGNEPSVLVIADTPRARQAAVGLVARLEARAIAPASFDDGVAELDGLLGPVFVEVEEDRGAALDRLLDRLDEDAAMLRRSSLVGMPAGLIDLAAARAPHPGVMLLPDADEGERLAALGVAIARSQPSDMTVQEESAAPLQLLQLSEEVGRIARALAALSGATEPRSLPRAAPATEARPPSAATVRAVIRTRRLREQFFQPVLFADPAWDMMLDLYAARLEGRPVAVSSLCIAASVPPTTALRWMKQLVDDELFVRIADPRDGRRVFIELSPATAGGLAGYFEAIGRIGFALP